MINVVTYLLPLSGSMLLNRLDELSTVSIEAAFVPESYYNNCDSSLEFLEQNDIPYAVPSSLDEEVHNWIADFGLDLGLSVGYDRRLPDWLYDYPRMGTINLHPSLLPRYRGANPYFWAIKNQENETGVTLHYMDENLDTGPIINQSSFSLDHDTTMGELFTRLNVMGVEMIVEVIDTIVNDGSAPTGNPQSTSGEEPYAPKIRNRHLRIDWTESYDAIEAHVRAGNPHFCTFTSFKGQKIRLYEVSRPPEKPPGDSQPSTIQKTEDGPVVRCDDGWVRLDVVQVDQKYTVSGKEFQRREQRAFEVLDKVV